MIDISRIDYFTLDKPDILRFLFHPRPEYGGSQPGSGAEDILIPVEKDIVLGARFHMVTDSAPNIMFFHGNGEIVADYDDMGYMYGEEGINFLPVDYRGYGRSSGSPTITSMMRDCHVAFDYMRTWLRENGYGGPLVIMGRSLGSAPALELAANYGDLIDGLAVESGFASTGPLFALLGIDLDSLGIGPDAVLSNTEKIRSFTKPTLIIHAENDHIIPFADGLALYEAAAAHDKQMLPIPGADHNTIFLRGMSAYMTAVRKLVQSV